MQQEQTEVAPALFTVERFAEKHHTWATQAAIRNHILNARDRFNSRGERIGGNGLAEAGAIIRVGRRVLVHEANFFKWLASQQRKAA
jgi:hypothetical protein